MGKDKRTFIRNLMAGFGVGAAAMSATGAQAQGGRGWAPASEPQDAWLDQTAARHRQVFDTISPDGVARALTFTHTFYVANKDGYGLEPKDLAVLMILRSGSTGFGFNDKMWAKYFVGMAKRANVIDPVTKDAPVINIYNAADRAKLLPTNGLTLEALAGMGGRFAICSVATRHLAEALAKDSGGNADAIYAELAANLIVGARLAPAGIIAVNRAQEHHYALCYTA